MEKILKKPVSSIMTKDVIAVKSDENIKHLFKLMDDNAILGVPVVDDSNNVVGIVTESDLINHFTTLKTPRGVHLLGSIVYLDSEEFNKNLKEHCAEAVGDLMTSPAITITDDQKLIDLINLMSDKKVSRLPVVDGKGKLVGIVSRGDVVHEIARLKNI